MVLYLFAAYRIPNMNILSITILEWKLLICLVSKMSRSSKERSNHPADIQDLLCKNDALTKKSIE